MADTNCSSYIIISKVFDYYQIDYYQIESCEDILKDRRPAAPFHFSRPQKLTPHGLDLTNVVIDNIDDLKEVKFSSSVNINDSLLHRLKAQRVKVYNEPYHSQ
jgi:hypothetical protein